MNPFPLGRRQASDKRDEAFPMSAVLPAKVELPTFKYWAGWRTHLDQTGETCVANSLTHLVCDSPRSHRLADVDSDLPGWRLPGYAAWNAGYVDSQSGEKGFRGFLYHQAQMIDEFADTPPSGGTSVRAGAKVLQSIGVLSAYHWAMSMEDIIRAVLSTGPVVVGTNWYEDMFSPEGSKAILHPTGPLVGGHAWKIDGFNLDTALFRMKNSWGTGWGLNGYAHIHEDDLDRLVFDEMGEAVIGVER